eukprot:CAMPEP_0119052490 /NCGR_PEP_ID=MMETSP1177-20130426/73771_1 /TAXON_ID=2985 /ORGANISM="Ochromonas sp, Strain CCMP1899" /LENGTH=366 /DNA_ID=CAMNT_0007032075 /DNA_START=222 /DNA_END=1322 /DNA_ORIENTATION=-
MDAFKAEADFYWNIDKNRKRDRVNFLQDLMKDSLRLNGGVGGDFYALDDNLKAELKRQYDESLTVEPNDSPARLGHKLVIHTVIRDLFNRMNIVMFSAIEEKKRLILITDAMQKKLQRLMDLTEANRLKHFPSKPDLPIACVDILRRKFEKNVEPEKPTKMSKVVPRNRAPFYQGPPSWMFPEGLAAIKEIYKNTYSFMFRNIHVQRGMDKKHRFYCFNYPPENYCPAWMRIPGREPEIPLSYLEHCRLHRIGGASVTAHPEAEAVILTHDVKMTVQGFNDLDQDQERTGKPSGVTILLPHVIVGSCDYCKKPAVGECICGECYCSAACHEKDWPSHYSICHQVLDNNTALTMATPFGWGQKTFDV